MARRRTAASEESEGAVAERGEILVLAKVSAILDHLLAGPPEVGPTEIATAIGASKTTAYRLLRSMEATGLLDRSPSGAYRLGVKLISFGRVVESRLDVRREAQPIVEALARTTRQTAFLFLPDASGATCVLRVPGEDVEVLAVSERGALPYHVGAAPKVMAAFMPEERIEQYLRASGLKRYTEHTITDAKLLRRELAGIRERGYAVSWGDVTPGVAALGAPVLSSSGEVIAAVSIAGIAMHFGHPKEPAFVSDVLQAAAKVGARVGISNRHTPRPPETRARASV